MKTTNFTGEYFERGITRKITTTDPATGRDVSRLAKLDLVTDLVIDRVSGHGVSERTGENQITLSGQFAPFKQLRITASAQNYDKVVAFLQGKVNKDEKSTLKEEIVVKAVGTPMKGFGLSLTELYVRDSDGKNWTPVIAPPESMTSGNSVADQIF